MELGRFRNSLPIDLGILNFNVSIMKAVNDANGDPLSVAHCVIAAKSTK